MVTDDPQQSAVSPSDPSFPAATDPQAVPGSGSLGTDDQFLPQNQGNVPSDPLAQVGDNNDPLAGLLDPAGGAPAGDQKNPLDVLEELLKESQAKIGPPGGGKAADAPAEPAGPTPEQLQQQAELEERLRQQAVLDQQAIEKRRIELLGLKDTPQYQARVQQDQAKADDLQSKDTAGQGFQILQLDHTKI